MRLNHPQLDDFQPTLERLMTTAFTTGLQELEKSGWNLSEALEDRSMRRRFARACHYGYELTQRQVGSLVVELEERIRKEQKEIRELRRIRDEQVNSKLEIVRILGLRQLVLRRLIDALLCTMLNNQTWVLKRLISQQAICRIDPQVLRRTLDVVVERNRENRMRFALILDLTTFAHIGDLVEIDLDNKSGPRWKVIELKEGKVNETLSGLLPEEKGLPNEEGLRQIRDMLGEHASKQATRIVRQRKKLAKFKEIIETDRGVDPQYNEEIHLFPDPVGVENYTEAINKVCDGALTKGVDVAVVDGCLTLVGIKDEYIQRTNFGVVRHIFFHLTPPKKACLLNDQSRCGEELEAMGKIPPFVDLIHQNLLARWGTPLYSWLSRKHTTEVLMGRVRVFVQFDLRRFFNLALARGITMTWITRGETDLMRKLSTVIPGSPNSRAIKAQLMDGTEQVLFSGFIARAIGDVTSPSQLLDLVERIPEQKEKMKVRLQK
jgi:hypothetical protein